MRLAERHGRWGNSAHSRTIRYQIAFRSPRMRRRPYSDFGVQSNLRDLCSSKLVESFSGTGRRRLARHSPSVTTPAELGQTLRVLQTARTPVHFRLLDYLYPSSVTDVHSWLTRSRPTDVELALALKPFTARDLRIPVIAALDAVLDASGATVEELLSFDPSSSCRPLCDRLAKSSWRN